MSDYSQRRDREKAQRARNLRQDYAEVQALYNYKLSQGMTQAQAATSQGSVMPGSYTVKVGDTIATIAERTGISPQDILKANPDVNQLQTGMVLQYNKPVGPTLPTGQPANPVTGQQGVLNPQAVQGSEAWRIQQQNSGLMSYKPVAVTAPPVSAPQPQTPQTNYLEPGYKGFAPQNPGRNVTGGTPTPNPIQFSFHPQNPGRNMPGGGNMSNPIFPANAGRNVMGGGNMSLATNPGRNVIGGVKTLVNSPPSTTTPLGTPAKPPLVILPEGPTEVQFVLRNLVNKIAGSYVPTQAEIDQLRAHGLLAPVTPPSYNSNGNYQIHRGGGGGGGGGGNKMPRPAAFNNNNLPAFSTGSSFRGLVNWRV